MWLALTIILFYLLSLIVQVEFFPRRWFCPKIFVVSHSSYPESMTGRLHLFCDFHLAQISISFYHYIPFTFIVVHLIMVSCARFFMKCPTCTELPVFNWTTKQCRLIHPSAVSNPSESIREEPVITVPCVFPSPSPNHCSRSSHTTVIWLCYPTTISHI